MKLPAGDEAPVDITKLRDFCLNPHHPRGRHKAKVLVSSLGLKAGDAEFLRDALIRAARENDAIAGESDLYGHRYILDFDLVRGDRRAEVRSMWIVLRGEGIPRLTTCFVR